MSPDCTHTMPTACLEQRRGNRLLPELVTEIRYFYIYYICSFFSNPRYRDHSKRTVVSLIPASKLGSKITFPRSNSRGTTILALLLYVCLLPLGHLGDTLQSLQVFMFRKRRNDMNDDILKYLVVPHISLFPHSHMVRVVAVQYINLHEHSPRYTRGSSKRTKHDGCIISTCTAHFSASETKSLEQRGIARCVRRFNLECRCVSRPHNCNFKTV